MPLNRQPGPTRSVFATLIVAALLVAFGGVERFAPADRGIDQGWQTTSFSAGPTGRSCGALPVWATAGALHGSRTPTTRPFVVSRRAWISDSIICVSDPIPSSSGFVGDGAVARTHDATGPPPVSLPA